MAQFKRPVEDTIRLGGGHSLMVGHLPTKITDHQSFSNNFFDMGSTKENIEAFGFFGSGLNYNTFYPELSMEDIVPKDSDYINPVFRLLSQVIVSKYYPTDFSMNGALKASMPLMLGQTVNTDHEMEVGNAIGSVTNVTWQEAYEMKGTDGKKVFIPAGMNGTFKIDAKSNPRLARGILMDPPSIHSNSVTVQFSWDKSHPKLDDNEFYHKMGTYDDKGQLIRKVVTEIKAYYETSLVGNGADSFAKQIKDNKIVLPTAASAGQAKYNFESEKAVKKHYFFVDYKTPVNRDELMLNTMGDLYIGTETHNNSLDLNDNQSMNELEAFVASLFGTGMLTLGEGKEATQEAVVTLIKELVESNSSMTEKVTQLEADKTKLETEKAEVESKLESYKVNAGIGESYINKLKEDTTANYRKLFDGKIDEAMLTLISGANSETLNSLNNQYITQLSEKFPHKCGDCGSTNISRLTASAPNEEEDDDNLPKPVEVKDTSAALRELYNNLV